MTTLIVAFAVLIPVMTIVIWLCPALHELIERTGRATAEAELAEAAAARLDTAVSEAAMPEAIAAEKAHLAAVTAAHEAQRQVTEATVEHATGLRLLVMDAEAQAEIAAAPAKATLALDVLRAEARTPGDMNYLASAYSAYCQSTEQPRTWFEWVGSWKRDSALAQATLPM